MKIFAALCVLALPGFAAAPPPGLLAVTHGTFSVRYTLAKEGKSVRAVNVKVRVKNKICYFRVPDARLKEHERTHALINRAERRRMEKSLEEFRAKTEDLKKAEKMFLEEFKSRVGAVEKLHAAWDANHTFPIPST